jgi:hypothetical protein
VASIPPRDRFMEVWNGLALAKQRELSSLIENPRPAGDAETAALVVGFCRYMRWRLTEGPPAFARKYVTWTDLPRYKMAEVLNLPLVESDEGSAE